MNLLLYIAAIGQCLWALTPNEPLIREEARKLYFDVTLKNTSEQEIFELDSNVEVFPVNQTIYIIADLHGDFLATVSLLYGGGLIDRNGGWTGGDSIIIQLGDIADRGPDSPAIYELFWRLKDEAQLVGGTIIHLFGNHEVMNLMGQTHYISTRELRRYYEGSHQKAVAVWNPITGPLGRKVLATFRTTYRLGDLLFVHAGLLPKYASIAEKSEKGTLDFLDENMKSAILAFAKGDIPQYQSLKDVLEGDTSPIWTRELTHEKSLTSRCRLVATALNKTKLTRQFVGHTPTRSQRIEPYCNNTFIQTDTGNSRWMYDSQTMTRIQTTLKRDTTGKSTTSVSTSQNSDDKTATQKKNEESILHYQRTFDELYISTLPTQDPKNKTKHHALTLQWSTLFADEVCIMTRPSSLKQVQCQPAQVLKNDEL